MQPALTLPPRVSVTIPCYNSAPFIRETIASVLRQTYTNFEVVVVDDGSLDGTFDIVSAIGDPRIRVEHQENQGLGRTRNRLLKLSRGEVIAFLDHDDRWLPNKLEAQIAAFDRSPGVGLVYTDAIQIYENGQRAAYSSFHPPHRGQVMKELIENYFILLSSAAVPRQLAVDLGGFPDEYQVAEEAALFFRIAADHPIEYVNEPLVEYYFHPGNTSRRVDLYVKETEEIYDYWLEHGDSEVRDACLRAKVDLQRAAGRQSLFRLGDAPKARGYLREAIRRGSGLEARVLWALSFMPRGVVKVLRRLALATMRS